MANSDTRNSPKESRSLRDILGGVTVLFRDPGFHALSSRVYGPQPPAMERSRFSLQLGLQRARLYYYLVCGIPDPQNSGYRDGRKALIHLAAFDHPDHECSRDNPASFARVECGQRLGKTRKAAEHC